MCCKKTVRVKALWRRPDIDPSVCEVDAGRCYHADWEINRSDPATFPEQPPNDCKHGTQAQTLLDHRLEVRSPDFVFPSVAHQLVTQARQDERMGQNMMERPGESGGCGLVPGN